MGKFSFGRVAQYARYHYTTQQKTYLTFVLAMLGVPLFFGILSRDVNTTVGMAVAVYLAGALGVARNCIKPLRERGTKIMESVMPVSTEERIVLYLFNSMVAYPIVAFLTAVVALVLTVPFDYADINIAEAIIEMGRSTHFMWALYLFVQVIASASLLLNIIARRSLLVAYVAAAVGFTAFLIFISRVGLEIFINYEGVFAEMESLYMPEWLAITIYAAIPVTLYAIAYWALRRRQMKW